MSAATGLAQQRAPRRADADTVRLSGRDVVGLLLCADQCAAPYDLLAAALEVRPAQLPASSRDGVPPGTRSRASWVRARCEADKRGHDRTRSWLPVGPRARHRTARLRGLHRPGCCVAQKSLALRGQCFMRNHRGTASYLREKKCPQLQACLRPMPGKSQAAQCILNLLWSRARPSGRLRARRSDHSPGPLNRSAH